jgi:hypothetical protein
VTLTANEAEDGFVFSHWTNSAGENVGSEAILVIPECVTETYTAVYEEAKNYIKDGNYIYFGTYPQTIKTDDVTITNTLDDRGYYLGSDGEYYAQVTAATSGEGYTFSSGVAIANREVYYFKVEPIRWRILSEDGDVAFLLCDSIIDNMSYSSGKLNYANSDVRAWLNNQFYNTAFDELQKEIILTTIVDNGWQSAGGIYPNPNVCENTEDKIFLISSRDLQNTSYGFSNPDYTYDEKKQMLTSDYSRAKRVWMSTSAETYGYGDWLTRSPDSGTQFNMIRAVNYQGKKNYFLRAYDDAGIVPALIIRL